MYNRPLTVQYDTSFQEQNMGIKPCLEDIDKYVDICQINMIKSCTICGYTDSSKSWCIQYCLLYCISTELIRLLTPSMSRRLVFSGSKHIDHIFAFLFDKKNKPL